MAKVASIIIPTKNEEKNIKSVLATIPISVKEKSEILVIDSSKDKTPLIAKECGAKVIKVKGGKGRAIRKGIESAKGKILIFTDGDGEYDSKFMSQMLRYVKKYDVVLGCHGLKKFKNDDKHWKEVYRLAAFLANIFFRKYGVKLKDPLTGFRLITKDLAKKLKLQSNGLEIETEMNIKFSKMKLKIKEIPVPNLRRKSGESKYVNSFFNSIKLMIKTLEKYKDWKQN
jgi:glycosyltransferase involved in cell wall biosynthesis